MFFDLIDYYTEDRRAVDTSVQVALEILLQDTPFKVGLCDDLGIATAYFIEENKLKSINDKIIPRWNCEIEIDNYTVTAKRRIGEDRNYRISRGKNLKGVNYHEDVSNVVTRLYAKGYDGLTFEDINGGKKYVDSPLIGKYAHVKAGDHHFDDIEDKKELLDAAKEHVLTLDKPYIHYDIDLVELRDSDDYKHYRDLEVFGLGDTVQVYNDKLDIDIGARILEYEYNPKRKQNSVVVLGNFTQRLEDTLGQFEDTKRKVDNSITDDGYVRTSRLQGVIDLLTNELIASSSYQHAVPFTKGALFENTNPQSPDYGALVAVPGKFAIANKKKADGSWDWRVFGNGNGFVADYITSGIFDAGLIRAGILMSLDGSVHIDMETGQFKIGDASGNRSEITNTYGKWYHKDGSYTKISWDGLERYEAGTGRQYHHMTKIIKFSVGGDGVAPSNRWIPIGKEFNNKDWSVALSISDSMTASSAEAALHRIVLTQGHDSNNKPLQPRYRDGQWEFPVMGYTTYYSAKSDSRRYGDVAGIMIITA